MPSKILVPIDGSQFSEHALPMALTIARRNGAHIHLVRVHEPIGTVSPFAGMPPYDPSWDRQLRDQAELELQTLADRLAERDGVVVHAEVIGGPAVDALAAYAIDAEIDLIVMTTHGRGGISRFWLGSVADGLVRRSTRPVLLLRPGEANGFDVNWPPVLDHVLIPLDGSEFSEQVIDRAIAVTGASNARFTLLRVISPAFVPDWSLAGMPPVPTPPDLAREHALASGALESVAQRLRGRSLEVATAVVLHAQPAIGIVEFAERNGVGLIAMTTHGRRGLTRLTLGSAADKVLRGTNTPLLLFRPRASGSRVDADTAPGLTADDPRRVRSSPGPAVRRRRPGRRSGA